MQVLASVASVSQSEQSIRQWLLEQQDNRIQIEQLLEMWRATGVSVFDATKHLHAGADAFGRSQYSWENADMCQEPPQQEFCTLGYQCFARQTIVDFHV